MIVMVILKYIFDIYHRIKVPEYGFPPDNKDNLGPQRC